MRAHFVAALDQANAQLGERLADASRAARDVERDKPLAEARAIPKSQLENDVQIHRAAEAAVSAARANVQQAELDLGFTKVRSLIDGIVGITEVQIGNLVSPTSVLTTVSQVQPIRAWFAISEQEYLDVADRLRGATPRQRGIEHTAARIRAHADRRFDLSSHRLVSVRQPASRLADRHAPHRDVVSESRPSASSRPVRSHPRRDEGSTQRAARAAARRHGAARHVSGDGAQPQTAR